MFRYVNRRNAHIAKLNEKYKIEAKQRGSLTANETFPRLPAELDEPMTMETGGSTPLLTTPQKDSLFKREGNQSETHSTSLSNGPTEKTPPITLTPGDDGEGVKMYNNLIDDGCAGRENENKQGSSPIVILPRKSVDDVAGDTPRLDIIDQNNNNEITNQAASMSSSLQSSAMDSELEYLRIRHMSVSDALLYDEELENERILTDKENNNTGETSTSLQRKSLVSQEIVSTTGTTIRTSLKSHENKSETDSLERVKEGIRLSLQGPPPTEPSLIGEVLRDPFNVFDPDLLNETSELRNKPRTSAPDDLKLVASCPTCCCSSTQIFLESNDEGEEVWLDKAGVKWVSCEKCSCCKGGFCNCSCLGFNRDLSGAYRRASEGSHPCVSNTQERERSPESNESNTASMNEDNNESRENGDVAFYLKNNSNRRRSISEPRGRPEGPNGFTGKLTNKQQMVYYTVNP